MVIKKSFAAHRLLAALLIMPCIFFFYAATAKYKLTVTKGTYSELSGAADLSFISSDSGYYYAANFIFPVFNRLADFNQVASVPSNGGFISAEGYLAVYEKPGYTNTIVFQCLYDHNDFKTWLGITTVSAKMEGATGNRILKFQWKDVVNQKDVAQRINFQVWLHEADSSVSYHYGPNTLSTQVNQNYSGMVVLAPNFYNVLDECNVEGSPSKPVVYDTFTTVALPTLDSIPANGTVYTFKKVNTSSVQGLAGNAGGFIAFPNPAGDVLYIATPVPAAMVYLCDMTGKTVAAISTGKGTTRLSTADIPAGIYFLRMQAGGDVQVKKLCINH